MDHDRSGLDSIRGHDAIREKGLAVHVRGYRAFVAFSTLRCARSFKTVNKKFAENSDSNVQPLKGHAFERSTVSLKRYPDTKREFSRGLWSYANFKSNSN